MEHAAAAAQEEFYFKGIVEDSSNALVLNLWNTLILCEIQLARTYSSICSLHFKDISLSLECNLCHLHKFRTFPLKFLSYLKFCIILWFFITEIW